MIDKRILKKLRGDRSKAAVYAEIAKKREQYDNLISSEDAAYILAAEKQIDLFKYLERDVIERIRDLASQKQARTQARTQEQVKDGKSVRKRKPREVVIKIDDRILPPGVLSQNLAKEAYDMARVYHLIYILENSIRYLIISKLSETYGDDWWNLATISMRIKKKADKLMKDEKQNKWYRPRGDHPIFYTTIGSLSSIISSNWDSFKDVGLSSPQWVEFHIGEIIENSRNTIMHSNPLSDEYIRRLRDVFDDWMRILTS